MWFIGTKKTEKPAVEVSTNHDTGSKVREDQAKTRDQLNEGFAQLFGLIDETLTSLKDKPKTRHNHE